MADTGGPTWQPGEAFHDMWVRVTLDRDFVIKEIEADMKEFGDDRRTLIQEDKRAVAETKVIDEPVTVIVSQKGWVRVRQGHEHDTSQFSFKAGDALYATFEVRTVDVIQGFGSDGRVYTVPVSELPGARGDGSPLTSFVNLAPGSQMVAYYSGQADDLVLISTRAGYGFLANVADMTTRNKAGKSFISIDSKFEGDLPLGAAKVQVGMKQVACLSAASKLLVFPLDELKRLPTGGKGVILMGIDDKEALASAIAVGPAGASYFGAGRGGKHTELNLDAKTLKSAKVHVALDGHHEVLTDATFPFEFSLPLKSADTPAQLTFEAQSVSGPAAQSKVIRLGPSSDP